MVAKFDMHLPIIIGGSHRSGTTLVRRLLNGHPHIACPLEIKFHKDLLQQFPNDPLAHGRLGASINALGLAQEEWLDEFGRALVRCHEISAFRQGKRRWADKNPENSLNIEHWDRLLKEQLHFLLVVRHPFDILASMAEIGMPRVLPSTLIERAWHVKNYIESGLAYLDSHSSRASMLCYEDLVTSPEITMTTFLSNIGEEFYPEMIFELGSKRHGVGLEDPKAADRYTISMHNIGRWRNSFNSKEVDELLSVLGNLLERLEYSY